MRTLIIGGYGNFGSYVARALAPDAEIQLLIGGRSGEKARAFATTLDAANPAEGHALDFQSGLAEALARIRPDLVIHTTGPFQTQDHGVARACIAQGCHYLDLADARHFVTGITALDAAARERNLLIVSGASSVPCLTAAIVDHYRPAFARLEAIDYGITAAQQTNRGLATTAAILSYVGKPFETLRDGKNQRVFGWQDTHSVLYPEFGRRWFGNCDIPDLDLFPARYPELRSVRFSAGHELAILHLGTWLLGWTVRLGLISSLDRHAEGLLRLAFLFDRFGSGRSGFHMHLTGVDEYGRAMHRHFTMLARSGHGPNIPCMPVILLAQRLARNQVSARGAQPCVDLINLDDYLAALTHLDISILADPLHA